MHRLYRVYYHVPMNRRPPACILLAALIFTGACSHAETALPGPATVPEVRADAPVQETELPETMARDYLVRVLVEKGVEVGRARSLIGDPRLVIDPGFILKNLRIAPPKDSTKTPGIMTYDPAFIARGRAFIRENAQQFRAIEERYGTSPRIVTAVLVIESRLGTYPMRYRAMRVFSNMTLVQDQAFVEGLREHYPGLCELLDDEQILKTATAKARWASGELYQLIVLADELGLDPHEIMGSVSGALGPAQFIPSTFRKYGEDGDADGRKDPFSLPDAMASIAGFLKKSGWRENGDEKRNRQALWIYNHSDIYVNTILKIYQELSAPDAESGP